MSHQATTQSGKLTPMAEPGGLAQAIEFLRQVVTKKASSTLFGTARVTLLIEAGEVITVELEDKTTHKPKKRVR